MLECNWLDRIQRFYVSAYLRTNLQRLTGKESSFEFLQVGS